MKKCYWWLIVFVLGLSACKSTDANKVIKAITSDKPDKAFEQIAKDKSKEYQRNPEQFIKDVQGIKALLAQLTKNASRVWGKNDTELPSNKRLVKYSNKYQARAIVDFELGWVRVETISKANAQAMLKSAIVTTILTPADPKSTDIFSDKVSKATGKPYLYEQVLDQDNKPIAYQWRANRFAQYLIKEQLQTKRIDKNTVHFVEFDLVEQHQHLRQQQYASYVLAAAKKYQVSPSLIYAIIETESSFNPFAVSHANAYGLMQVVPTTAGKDVYEKVKKRSGMPNKQTLFDPASNIDIGTAYLSLLDDRYLAGVNQSLSRKYSVISAYNGGAGNVLNTFSSNRSYAVTLINQHKADHVYRKLTTKHPRAESRRYLVKVTKAEKKYLN